MSMSAVAFIGAVTTLVVVGAVLGTTLYFVLAGRNSILSHKEAFVVCHLK